MSKEIQLYSEDGKYMCAVELSETQDRFKCPDHSVITLFEKREKDEIYLIAEAFDRILVTEKDKRISELEEELKIKQSTIDYMSEDNKITANRILELEQQIKEQGEELQQLYSHLGIEAFGEDIQEQAVKEIDRLKGE